MFSDSINLVYSNHHDQSNLIKIKLLSKLIFNTLFLAQNAILLFSAGDKELPIYYFSIIQHFGGITKFFYMIAILCSSVSIALQILFNNSTGRQYKWYEIIDVINESKPIESIELNPELISKFKARVKSVQKLSRICFQANIISNTLMTTTILVLNHNYREILFYGIPIISYHFAFIESFYSNFCQTFLYFYAISYYCKNVFILFNKNLLENNRRNQFLEYQSFDRLIAYHNKICRTIHQYNQFWQKYLFIIYYFITPLNLISVYSLFFLETFPLIKITFILTLILTTICILLFNSINSSINSESLKSYNLLQVYFLNKHQVLSFKRKIKVSKNKIHSINLIDYLIII